MGRILEAFAKAELFADEDKEKRSPDYQRICEEADKLEQELRERLESEEKELLYRLMNAVSDECSCYGQNKFLRGYRLGVLMTMEIFSEQDTLV